MGKSMEGYSFLKETLKYSRRGLKEDLSGGMLPYLRTVHEGGGMNSGIYSVLSCIFL